MKVCANCGASNADAVKFCGECGRELAAAPSLRTERPGTVGSPPGTRGIDASAFAGTIREKAATLQGRRKADVLFILDCTLSMQGEIDALKDAIMSFADTIESDGVRVRVGLVAFRDRLIGEEAQVLQFGGAPFTREPAAFRREVSALHAQGGGDIPESSLDAIALALRQPFEADTNKVLVLVTDAPPHIPDKDTRSIEEIVDAVRAAGVQQFHMVIRTSDSASQVYLKLLEGTRGTAFDLGKGDDFRKREEHFKRTLMSLGKTISTATR